MNKIKKLKNMPFGSLRGSLLPISHLWKLGLIDYLTCRGFPDGAHGKESPVNAPDLRDRRDEGLIPGLGISP